MAVSYTHLDVYKRQVNARIAEYEAEGLIQQWFEEAQQQAETMGLE